MVKFSQDIDSSETPSAAETLDGLPGMVYRCRGDDRRTLLYASSGALDLTGRPPEELSSISDLIHPDDLRGVRREIQIALDEHRPYECTYRLMTGDGRDRWVVDRGQGAYDDDHAALTLKGFIADASAQISAVQRLEQQLADNSRQLSGLYDILKMTNRPGELQSVLTQALKRVLVAGRGDGGFIHLRSRSGNTLHLVAWHGISRTVAENLIRVSAQDGLVAWVASYNQPLLIPDIRTDDRTIYLKAESRLRGYAGVPISTGPHVWGTLSVLGKNRGKFNDEDVALLATIGQEIGTVVENARLRRHAEHHLVAEERNRLARELHDSITQSLYSLTLFAEAGRRTAESGPDPQAADYFSQIGETGKQALKEMRLLLHKLRPSVLVKEGLVRALQHRLNAVEGRAGVKHRLTVAGEARIPPELEDALYHISQEALNNSLKHAMATEVAVQLELGQSDRIQLTIEDNGRGFDPAAAADAAGLGLTSMRERAESLGGTLVINSTVGKGTRVKANLVYRPDQFPPSGTTFTMEDLP